MLKEGVELPPTAASARRERECEIVGTASQRGGTSMNSFDACSDRAAFASMAAGLGAPAARTSLTTCVSTIRTAERKGTAACPALSGHRVSQFPR